MLISLPNTKDLFRSINKKNLNVILWNLQNVNEESYKNGGLNIKHKK